MSLAPSAQKLRLPRWLVIVLIGPFVGTLAVFLVGLVLGGSPGGPEDTLFVFLMIVFFGWMIGLLPAIMAAILWRMVPHDAPFPFRVAATLGIGAVCGLVGSVPGLVLLIGEVRDIPVQSFLLMAFAGAVGLAATALPGARR